jgi:hypothetical protein
VWGPDMTNLTDEQVILVIVTPILLMWTLAAILSFL